MKSSLSSTRVQGFTLIELLMVISLIVLLSVAIYGNFQSGISVMQRVAVSSPEEDVQVFLEKFSRDVSNSFPYKGILFEGKQEKVRFPTAILTVPELGGDKGIGRVTYSYDASSRSILKLSEDLSEIYQDKENKGTAILRNVHSIQFQYFEYTPSQQKFEWRESWSEADDKDVYLLAVKLEMEFNHEGETQRVSRTVPLFAWGQLR